MTSSRGMARGYEVDESPKPSLGRYLPANYPKMPGTALLPWQFSQIRPQIFSERGGNTAREPLLVSACQCLMRLTRARCDEWAMGNGPKTARATIW